MTLYFANPCGEAVTLMQEGVLGFIDTPHQQNLRPDDVIWCADNGCFSSRFKEAHWWAFLERHSDDLGLCAFATAPDVVGDARATLDRSTPWLAKIRALGYPAAFVAQDGIENTEIPWDEFDALFLGGTNDFKLSELARELVAEANERGKWTHCGRVNSKKRWKLMESWGCDSADGTFLTYGPEVNLPRLLRWFD